MAQAVAQNVRRRRQEDESGIFIHPLCEENPEDCQLVAGVDVIAIVDPSVDDPELVGKGLYHVNKRYTKSV